MLIKQIFNIKPFILSAVVIGLMLNIMNPFVANAETENSGQISTASTQLELLRVLATTLQQLVEQKKSLGSTTSTSNREQNQTPVVPTSNTEDNPWAGNANANSATESNQGSTSSAVSSGSTISGTTNNQAGSSQNTTRAGQVELLRELVSKLQGLVEQKRNLESAISNREQNQTPVVPTSNTEDNPWAGNADAYKTINTYENQN